MACTRYKWGPHSKLHFYRCTRTWHKMSGNTREFFITSKCNHLLLHNGQSWIMNDLPITAIVSSIDYLLFAWDQYILIVYECRMADSDLPVIQWSPISAGIVLPTTSSTTHFSMNWFHRHSAHHKEDAPLISLAYEPASQPKPISTKLHIIKKTSWRNLWDKSWETKEWMKSKGIKRSHSLVHHDVY